MTTTRDVSEINMAAGKINTNQDRRAYRLIQSWFAKEVCQHEWNQFVFRMFLEGKVSGWNMGHYMADPWKYSQVQWRASGFDFIDPYREAQALTLLYDRNMTTLEEIYGERGVDWRAAIDQKAAEQQYMDEKGIKPGAPALPGPGNPDESAGSGIEDTIRNVIDDHANEAQ
jgi:capsid protein